MQADSVRVFLYLFHTHKPFLCPTHIGQTMWFVTIKWRLAFLYLEDYGCDFDIEGYITYGLNHGQGFNSFQTMHKRKEGEASVKTFSFVEIECKDKLADLAFNRMANHCSLQNKVLHVLSKE